MTSRPSRLGGAGVYSQGSELCLPRLLRCPVISTLLHSHRQKSSVFYCRVLGKGMRYEGAGSRGAEVVVVRGTCVAATTTEVSYVAVAMPVRLWNFFELQLQSFDGGPL